MLCEYKIKMTEGGKENPFEEGKHRGFFPEQKYFLGIFPDLSLGFSHDK